MVPDFANLSIDEVEDWLRQELLYVDLIGQLPIKRGDFQSICDFIQKKFEHGSTLLIKNVPPALFVASMVFTARYSDLNARNFWRPYGSLVWDQDTLSQARCNEFRERFRKAVLFLEKEFDLVFPQRTHGDVVRPVYHHAIIPFYLQDYFADWIMDRWREIIEIPIENLISQLVLDNSFRYLPPTLKKFIEGNETRETAKELLTTLATAASLYAEGELIENIDILLATSPIHKSIWVELLKVYQEQELEIKTRQVKPDLEWVWAIEEHEMQLRIRNMIINSAEQPDRFVWAAEGESPIDAKIECRVLPWKTKNGWLIDFAYLEQGPINGQIVLLGEYGSILEASPVPKLPEDQPIMVFRITQQNLYGVPVDLSSNVISDGYWLLSMAEDVMLLNDSAHNIFPTQKLPVPGPLDKYGHKLAGIYKFDLPLTIKQKDLLHAKIDKREQVGGKPCIVGEKNNFKNLSDAVPPIFSDIDIWLEIPNAPKNIVNRGTLYLKNASSSFLYPLRELDSMGYISYENEGIKILLGNLLPNHLATYTVQIIIGLRSIFASPLQFAYLPNIEIIQPDPEIIYSPKELPVCEIIGLKPENIRVRSGTTLTPKGTGIKLVWSDLRDDPKLNIVTGDQGVTLEWSLKRVDAWISPKKDVYILDNLKNYEFHAISTDTSISVVNVRIDNRQGRSIYFGKKGRYSSILKNDPIFDLVREIPTPEFKLIIEMGSTSWVLAEIHKKISLEGATVKIRREANNTLFTFRCNLEQQWDGDTQFACSPILDPSNEVLLEKTTYLGNEHLFKCNLPIGFYQFQIYFNGKNLLNPPLIISNVDSCEKETEEYLGALQPYLVDKMVAKTLPPYLEKRFIEFLLAIFSDKLFKNHPDFLFRVLTSSIQSLHGLGGSSLLDEMPALSSLINTTTDTISKREDGFLPPWVVTDRPIYLELILPVKPITIKIFPLYLNNRASSGIGYSYLRVRGESKPADPIFVKWDILAGDKRYDVLLGLPENTNKKTYPKLNPELDIWPLGQCNYCGEILLTKLYKEHKHKKIKSELVDLTYAFELIARSSISNLPEELWYFEKPTHLVDRYQANKIADGDAAATILLSPNNPISLENYLFSILKTKERSTDDEIYIKAWFAIQTWQESFTHLEKMLANNEVKIPAFSAAHRLIVHLEPRDEYAWLDLDRQFLILALLLRGQAYQQGQILKLLEEIDLDSKDLIEMVEFADEISPELFGWGLAWAEVFYSHTLC